MHIEVRAIFGRFVWRGVNINDVTINPSRGSRMNPTLKVYEYNRVAHASQGGRFLPKIVWRHLWTAPKSNIIYIKYAEKTDD